MKSIITNVIEIPSGTKCKHPEFGDNDLRKLCRFLEPIHETGCILFQDEIDSDYNKCNQCLNAKLTIGDT